MSSRGTGSMLPGVFAFIFLGNCVQTLMYGSWVHWIITIGGICMAGAALKKFA